MSLNLFIYNTAMVLSLSRAAMNIKSDNASKELGTETGTQ